jgi:hypothetical protein
MTVRLPVILCLACISVVSIIYKCDANNSHRTSFTPVYISGLRPFTCSVCDASFSNRGNLNQHVRRRKHQGPSPPAQISGQ